MLKEEVCLKEWGKWWIRHQPRLLDVLECRKCERYGVQNLLRFLFQSFPNLGDSKFQVWQAPSCTQLMKASPMTITCKTAMLFTFFYLLTQCGHNLVLFLITEIVAHWNQTTKGTDTIVIGLTSPHWICRAKKTPYLIRMPYDISPQEVAFP